MFKIIALLLVFTSMAQCDELRSHPPISAPAASPDRAANLALVLKQQREGALDAVAQCFVDSSAKIKELQDQIDELKKNAAK